MSDPLAVLRDALSGRYSLERELGRGGMATVYLATDLKHGRQVALKVLDPELGSSGGGERFLREIEIAARLKHPHILSLIDSGEAGGVYYFVMPYVEGESLRDRLEREKQLPIEDAIQIAREVADGLGYAHRQGVVHRDIKPANILLSEGHALIADFGVARALEVEGQGLTRTGVAVGTPQYMSPEQASGTEEVDGRSDLYALGCVLYEMLAGTPPLVGPTAQATAGLRLTETATALPVLRDTVPGGLDRVTRKLLAKAPVDRYATAEKVGEALASAEVWASGKKKRSVGRKVLDAAIAVVLLAAGGYATTWFAGRESEEIVPIDASRLRSDLYAVLPFQVVGIEARESTTIPGYVRALFVDWGKPEQVADLLEVERLWREAGGTPDRRLSRRETVELGRRLRAGATVTGELRVTPEGSSLGAVMVSDWDGAELGSVDLTGSPDSLRELTQRSMISLIAQSRFDMDREQGEALARQDREAVGLYFDALNWHAFSDERRRLLDEAIAIDSTFALAALLKYQSGERPSESDRIAWKLRDRMTRKDRAVAEAFLGPRFDPPATAAGQQERWRTAWELNPHHAPTTFEYAEELILWNSLLPQEASRSGRSWRVLLRDVLDRFCRQCPLGAPWEASILEAMAHEGDAEWLHAYFERHMQWTEDVDWDDWMARPAYGRWLLAIAEGNEKAADEAATDVLEDTRTAMAGEQESIPLPAYSLPRVAVLAGLGVGGAESIVRWLEAESDPFLNVMPFDRERGRHDAYRQIRDSRIAVLPEEPDDWWHAPRRVFEWAYYGEPEAEETLDGLDAALEAEAAAGEGATAVCWQSQLRLHRGRREGVPDVIRLLEEDPAYAPLVVSRMCAPLLRLLVALGQDSDPMPALRAADGIMSEIPVDGSPFGRRLDLLRAANLVIGRTLRDAGHTEEALAVLRRRPEITGLPVLQGWVMDAYGFTADYLREEAPLFAALADTAAAIERYEHYFRLRDQRPDYEPWAAQWDSARAELAALKASR